MSDEMFPLNPGPGGVTPDLLWSGMVLLNERQGATKKEVGEFRQESRDWHDDVNHRLDTHADRLDDIEAWKQQQERKAAGRSSNTTYLWREILLMVLGIFTAGVGFGIVAPALSQLFHLG